MALIVETGLDPIPVLRIRQFGFDLIPVHCQVIPSGPFVILGLTFQIAADIFNKT